MVVDRNMQAQVVDFAQQCGETLDPLHAVGQAPRRLDGQGRIETGNLHVEFQRHVGHHGANRAQPHDSKFLAGYFRAGEALLFPLQGLAQFAREEIVDIDAVVAALDAGRLARYITDFPRPELFGRADVTRARVRRAACGCAGYRHRVRPGPPPVDSCRH
jgi:hypothetical protein